MPHAIQDHLVDDSMQCLYFRYAPMVNTSFGNKPSFGSFGNKVLSLQ